MTEISVSQANTILALGVSSFEIETAVLPGFHERLKVQLDHGLITKMRDWTGFFDFESLKHYERFHPVNENIQRVLYPAAAPSTGWQSPFSLEISLSQTAYVY